MRYKGKKLDTYKNLWFRKHKQEQENAAAAAAAAAAVSISFINNCYLL